jgi:hypothetical protein
MELIKENLRSGGELHEIVFDGLVYRNLLYGQDEDSILGNRAPPNRRTPTGGLPRRIRQLSAELWPCVEILVNVFFLATFEMRKASELTKTQRGVVFNFLEMVLVPTRLTEIKNFMLIRSPNCMNKLVLRALDFSIKKNRIDEVLKLVTSQALKKLYQNFMEINGINRNLNPMYFIKRKEINRRIFVHYFKREPVGNEHMRLFLIKNGVTHEWLEGAIGGNQKNPAFIQDLYNILKNSEELFQSYRGKINSMIRRILGIVEFVENPAYFIDQSELTLKVMSRLQEMMSSSQAKNPKMPCHKYLFKNCVNESILKIEEFAEERSIRLR